MHQSPSKKHLLAAAVFALILPAGVRVMFGQSPTANPGKPKSESTNGPLHFDVASIKPTPSSNDKTLILQFLDGSAFRGAPIRLVLQTAFGVDDDHIIGAPAWVNTNRYDFEAKVAPEDAPRLAKLKEADRRAMLIRLLTERFNLKFHHEMRERAEYALMLAKGGPRLTKGEPEPPAGFEPPKDTPPEKEHYKIMTVPGRIEADSVPMYVLADQLTRLHALGRTVVDKTGLTGNYNLSLRWTPDNLPFPLMSDPDGLGATTRSEDGTDAAPLSLFTAIQEQLGLKLVPEKFNVDVIVIDHIDPPSPN
jgi:uncharacterized protein (TIGR03435 family)